MQGAPLFLRRELTPSVVVVVVVASWYPTPMPDLLARVCVVRVIHRGVNARAPRRGVTARRTLCNENSCFSFPEKYSIYKIYYLLRRWLGSPRLHKHDVRRLLTHPCWSPRVFVLRQAEFHIFDRHHHQHHQDYDVPHIKNYPAPDSTCMRHRQVTTDETHLITMLFSSISVFHFCVIIFGQQQQKDRYLMYYYCTCVFCSRFE